MAAPPKPVTTWLSTKGAKIIDASTGAPVLLKAFHWYGMEFNLLPNLLSVDGVNRNGQLVILNAGRPYKTIQFNGPVDPVFMPGLIPGQTYEGLLDQMLRLGFNSIRISVCEDITWPDARVRTSVNGARQDVNVNGWLNPDLLDTTIPPTVNNQNFIPAIQVLDKIVAHCGTIGLRVVLDMHSCAPQDPYQGNTHAATHGLWYTTARPGAKGAGVTNTSCHIGIAGDPRSEQQWIAAMVALAQRYATTPAVCGFDLINEPWAATWDDNAATGWPAAAERCARAMQAVNPHALIIVEGTSLPLMVNDSREFPSYSGNLTGARARPVALPVPNKLVYSTHEYPTYPTPKFTSPRFPTTLPPYWDAAWGYLLTEGIAPIYIGEFGGDFRDPAPLATTIQALAHQSPQKEATTDRAWMEALARYAIEKGASWSYFSVNPGPGGAQPATTDTGVLLPLVSIIDCTTPDALVLSQLAGLLDAVP